MQVRAKILDDNGDTIWTTDPFAPDALPEVGDTVFFGVKGPYEVTARDFLFLREDPADDRPDVLLILKEVSPHKGQRDRTRLTW